MLLESSVIKVLELHDAKALIDLSNEYSYIPHFALIGSHAIHIVLKQTDLLHQLKILGLELGHFVSQPSILINETL